MGKRLIAICDPDEEYLNNFLEFVQEENDVSYVMMAFTSVQNFLDFSQKNVVDMLIISEKEELEHIPVKEIKQIVFLSEEEGEDCYGLPEIAKYQSMEKILNELKKLFPWENSKKIWQSKKPKKRILGVFSPVKRCYKTTFALSLGLWHTKTNKTLLINLEEFSGLSKRLQILDNRDLSDLIFYNQNSPNDIISKLHSMINSYKELDFLAPVRYSRDLRTISADLWSEVILKISDESMYDIIVLDIGNQVGDIFSFLDLCDIVYMPVLQDSISQSKVDEFFQCLEEYGERDLKEKIIKFQLPEVYEGELKEKQYESLLKEGMNGCIATLVGTSFG